MDPIATYSEVRFDGKRNFVLFPDRIHIRGSATLHSEFEFELPLASLEPRTFHAKVRNKAFWQGIWMTIISFVLLVILITGLNMRFDQFVPVLMVGGILAGFVLSAATFRKVEFTRFTNSTGVVVLDLARSGKQATQLDAFVDAVARQIKLVRQAG